jgi:hypothetical protein
MDLTQVQPIMLIVGLPVLFAYALARIPLARVLASLAANALLIYLLWIIPSTALAAGYAAFFVMPFTIAIGAVLIDLGMDKAKTP